MKGSDELDSVFGGIDLPFSSGVSSIFQKNLSSKYNLMRGSGFTHVSHKGSYEDNNDIIFVSEKRFAYKESKNLYPKFKDKDQITSISQSPTFPKSIRFHKVLIRERMNPGVGPADHEDRFILDITAYKKSNQTAKRKISCSGTYAH